MTNISLEPEGAWIEWNGGECPVPDDTPLEVRYRDGETETVYAANLKPPHIREDWWKHEGEDAYDIDTDDETRCHACDVVAYRVVKP